MNKLDGRKISHATLEEVRIRTVSMVRKGLSPEVAAKNLGFNRSTIYAWLKAYSERGGRRALKLKPVPGRPSRLNGRQISWICKALTSDKIQLQFEVCLWTRDRLRVVIKKKFKVSLGKTATGDLLRKLGFTFQKPTTRFLQQDPIIVKKWLEVDYKNIRAEAREAGADVYFGDEAGVNLNYKIAKTIGEKGVTPIIKRTSKRGKINMISAVSHNGECKFMLTEKNVNDQIFITFLQRLVKDSEGKSKAKIKPIKPVFLILDNHPIHKSKKMQKFVESVNSKSEANPKGKLRLKLFFLPPYSPELNPDELVWNHVKNHGISRTLISSTKQLKSSVASKLHQLQKLPEKVKSFFQTSTTRYAAA